MNILRTLDQLLEDTMLEADTFEALANPSDVRALSGACLLYTFDAADE